MKKKRIQIHHFTLLELAAVIAILSIVTVVVGPRIGKAPVFLTLENSIQRVKGVFLEASHQALARGRQVTVKYSISKKTLSISQKKKSEYQTDKSKKQLRTFYSYTIPKKISVEFDPKPEDNDFVTYYFYSDGSADGPIMKMKMKGNQVYLRISPLTGLVYILYQDVEEDG